MLEAFIEETEKEGWHKKTNFYVRKTEANGIRFRVVWRSSLGTISGKAYPIGGTEVLAYAEKEITQ